MAALMLAGCLPDSVADELADKLATPVVKNETIGQDSKWINSEIDGSIDADTPVNLKDDFYTAINRDWLLEPLGEGVKDTSRFTDTQDRFDDNLYYIMTADPSDTTGLDTNIMSEETLLHLQELVHTALDYGRDADTRNAQGAEPLRPYIERIANISTLDELTDYLCNTDGTNLFSLQLTPFSVDNPVDITLQDTYTVRIYPQGALSLQSPDQYTNLTAEGTYAYECNRNLLQYVLGQLGYQEAEIDNLLRACYRFESKYVRGISSEAVTADTEYLSNYSKILSKDELQELAGNYPILTILTAYGLDIADSVTVVETSQMREVGKLYTDANLEGMKAYFLVNTVVKAAGMLDDNSYELKEAYGKMGGTVNSEDEQPNTKHPDYDEWSALYSRYVTPYLDDAWQQIYIAHFCTAEEKQLAVEITNQIVDAFATCIREADWLGEETRSAALDKLNGMGLHILYPDKLTDYSSLNFDDCKNLVDIAAAVNQFNSKNNAAKVNQPIDPDRWDLTQLSTLGGVGALYFGMDNSVNAFAGLTADHYFLSADNSFEESLARFGSAVGHEITHGFDSKGYQYDKVGTYRSWWTKSDLLAFDMRTDKLMKYYSALTPVTRSAYLDGKNVAPEAIADMGGVKCCMVIASGMPDFDYDVFFRSYADIWREHSTYKWANQHASDEHPVAMLRTNVTLMQFDEFQKTYDIQPGDGMYLAAEDRILVW